MNSDHTCKAIIMKTQAGLDELEFVKQGTEIECEAYLFTVLLPSDTTKDLKRLECNDGSLFSVKKFIGGSQEWVEIKYLIMYYSEND